MKSFIIHLPSIESSCNSASQVKENLKKISNIEADFFDGSLGYDIKQEYQSKNRIWHPWGFKGPDNPYSIEYRLSQTNAGEMGCFDSHYRLWQKCIEINEPIMIFEDDLVLLRKFYLVDFTDVLIIASSHTKKMRKYIKYLEEPTGKHSAMPYGQASMPGCAGYIIKPHAAKILVEEFKNTFLPADNAINQYLVKIQIHSHMIGRASYKTEGNVSLIRTKFWNKDEYSI
jgi:glycosyl transferase family 25